MKLGLIILFCIAVVLSQPLTIETRFVGVVNDLKILSMDDQENVLMWVSANRDYRILGKKHIPNIYLNDSLFEYWVNYQFRGIGTHRNFFIYEPQK